jgi:hypothetical protein
METTNEIIFDALLKLEKYILNEKYKGYDPYDALTSPIFKLPILKNNKIIRFTTQQILRHLPFNIRYLFGIKKGYNPVTLGLCLQSYSYLSTIFKEKQQFYLNEIQFCIDELEKFQSKGYSGICWGYDFDWESRYVRITAYTPTVVVTGFITNALFECYRLTGNTKALELCKSGVNFVKNDLYKTYEDSTFCYSYSSFDRQVIFNATMKGARLLTHVYSITKEQSLLEEAKNTVRFVIRHQKENGAWSYSYGDSRIWIDNFHTGYILDCLDEYIKLSGDTKFEKHLQKGLNFYTQNFFENGIIPKYYNNSIYPVDSTAVAQSILTLTRFGYIDKAKKIALWMIQNMQDYRGFFYYQKHKYYTNKISYMRWSNAWMFVALSFLMKNVLV